VAKDAVKNNEDLSDDQHEPDERDCFQQRQGPGAENQELHREDRPKKGMTSRGEVQRESGSDRERDPQPDTALALRRRRDRVMALI
jgi:hypothetical protein